MSTLRFPGDGPPASFLHANGFTPAAYRPFLERLSSRLDVTAYPMRPLLGNPVDPAVNWADLGHDLAEMVAEGTIAVGHSFGATASMTAVAEHPDTFAALVLIEPAMVKRWQAWAFATLPYAVRQRIGPANSTRGKRDTWPNRDAFLQSCRRSGLYDGFSPEALQIFAESAVQSTDDGVTLVFPAAWEAHFYTNPPWPAPVLARVQKPLVGLRGQSSIFLDDARWSDLTTAQPRGWYRQAGQGAHLLPLEHPELAAQLVFEGLEAQGVLSP